MATDDAPDFETVITTVETTGDVPDAPDFQEIAVGPGGTPISGGGGGSDGWVPSLFGAGAWTIPPYSADGVYQVLGNYLVGQLLPVGANYTANYLAFWQFSKNGNTYTANKNLFGIYGIIASGVHEGSFNLLGTTAEGQIDAALNAGDGFVTGILTAPVDLVAGTPYFVAYTTMFSGSETLPTIVAGTTVPDPPETVAYAIPSQSSNFPGWASISLNIYDENGPYVPLPTTWTPGGVWPPEGIVNRPNIYWVVW